jgi:hypothetical protein
MAGKSPLTVAQTIELRVMYDEKLDSEQLAYFDVIAGDHALIRRILARVRPHVDTADVVRRAADAHLDELARELAWASMDVDCVEPVKLPDRDPAPLDSVLLLATTGLGGAMDDGVDSLVLRRLVSEHRKLRVAAARAKPYLDPQADPAVFAELEWAAQGMPNVRVHSGPSAPIDPTSA